jgi:8-oxo-dGTP diphosphatase
VTFPFFNKGEDYYVFLFTAKEFTGELIDDCPEGNLEWVDSDKLLDLNLWDGDKYFIPLLNKLGSGFGVRLKDILYKFIEDSGKV